MIVRVHAPGASTVDVVVGDPAGQRLRRAAGSRAADGRWVVDVEARDGDRYRLVVDGVPLVDPHARDLVLRPDGPWGVVQPPWPRRPQRTPLAARAAQPLVYELHVKGFGGGYLGCIDHLDHVVSLGVDVIELLPVHPFDDGDNYWGYMPIVWGAVHRGYAVDPERAADELATLIEAAHDRGLDVWIDVVFNHTGEGGGEFPAITLRGLDPALHRRHADGRLVADSGCGNDIDPSHPYVRELVLEGLDRYADLGVDGFRFDLASLLTRDGGGLVELITAWAEQRGVELVAEAWDLGAYQVGHGWPWPSWRQWNDRFRDDVRGLVRGEAGLVHAVRRRVEASPDLFADPPVLALVDARAVTDAGALAERRTLNFLTAHDGLTLHDLTLVTSDRHRAWDTGALLRLQQLKNYFAVLLLSRGAAMWVMGDEFGRTQHGNDNPYNVDGPLSWVDWTSAGEWHELTSAVRTLAALRRAHPPGDMRFHGVDVDVDEGFESHSLAWSSNGLYVMLNAWWEPLEFGVHEPGDWSVAFSSAEFGTVDGTSYRLGPRSVVVLEQR
ncbi:MAG: alpha-amylase family glycosyl hydrolase [Ilumatobacteraceae bacterium]